MGNAFLIYLDFDNNLKMLVPLLML